MSGIHSNIDFCRHEGVRDNGASNSDSDKEITYNIHENTFQKQFGRRLKIYGLIPQSNTHNINAMYEKMDPILKNIPHMIKEQNAINKQFEFIMNAYFKHNNKTDSMYTSRNIICTAKEYIFPWLTVHLEEVYKTRLENLFDLNKRIYIQINSIIENLGHHTYPNPETYRCILSGWKHFCEAIVFSGMSKVGSGTITVSALYQANQHYKGVSKFCTKILSKASNTAKHNRHSIEIKSETMPAMNEVIKAWLQCQERIHLIKQLEKAYNNSKLNGIDKNMFSTLTEFVAMELIIYGTIETGSFVHMKLKTLKKIRPMWTHDEKTADPFNLPECACFHQKNCNGDIIGIKGITGREYMCCPNYAVPVAYGIENKKNASIIMIPPTIFEWLQMYIFIRRNFFHKKHDVPCYASENHDDARVFVTHSGQPINLYQGNILHLCNLNEAIFGSKAGIIVTPKMLNKWNKIYLSTHEAKGIRQLRYDINGYNNAIFEEHYNIKTYCLIRDATLALIIKQDAEQEVVKKLSKFLTIQVGIGLRKEAIEESEAQAACMITRMHHSSWKNPIDKFSKSMLKKIINKISPGLWDRVSGKKCLKRHIWMSLLLQIVASNRHNDCEHLRDLIFELYRGNIDKRLRHYTGAEHHLFHDLLPYPKENCPLWSIIGLIYRSARADVRNNDKTLTSSNAIQDSSDDDMFFDTTYEQDI